jgi:hypothetical protein
MKTLTRKVCVFVAALILAVVLTSATGTPRCVYARCGTGVTTQIWNETNIRQNTDTVGGKTSDTQDISERTEIHRDNGEDSAYSVTHHVNPDGSSHEHTESHGTDQGIGGNECYPEMGGKPWKSDTRKDDDKDSKGNRKEHYEEIINKNGKCTKYVRDSEWDSKGNLIKNTESRTDVPCGKWILEWKRVGNSSGDGVEILFGPNTTNIYLEPKGDGTYIGKGEGVCDQNYGGKCTGHLDRPFSVDVTAKEVKFGDQDELEFSMKATWGQRGFITCEGKSHDAGTPAVTVTNNFSIPPSRMGRPLLKSFPCRWGPGK